jgi:hypothetical protein
LHLLIPQSFSLHGVIENDGKEITPYTFWYLCRSAPRLAEEESDPHRPDCYSSFTFRSTPVASFRKPVRGCLTAPIVTAPEDDEVVDDDDTDKGDADDRATAGAAETAPPPGLVAALQEASLVVAVVSAEALGSAAAIAATETTETRPPQGRRLAPLPLLLKCSCRNRRWWLRKARLVVNVAVVVAARGSAGVETTETSPPVRWLALLACSCRNRRQWLTKARLVSVAVVVAARGSAGVEKTETSPPSSHVRWLASLEKGRIVEVAAETAPGPPLATWRTILVTVDGGGLATASVATLILPWNTAPLRQEEVAVDVAAVETVANEASSAATTTLSAVSDARLANVAAGLYSASAGG